MSADELRRRYAIIRRRMHRRPVSPKRKQEYVDAMVAFVQAARPHPGKGRGNTPWTEVWGAWNKTSPHTYSDEASMKTAFNAAKKRRRDDAKSLVEGEFF